MRCLLLSSCLLLLFSCKTAYKGLQPATGDMAALEKLRPNFTSALYKAEINVTGHYLSGLLLIKKLPDNSTRFLFSNELGLKFFDLEFDKDDNFKAHYVIKQMDKGPVIKTLKKDLELIMLNTKTTGVPYLRKDGNSLYHIFPKVKGTYCYITDPDQKELLGMEIASPRKPIVHAIMKNYTNGIPDTIAITHKNFNFTIGLKKLERKIDATE